LEPLAKAPLIQVTAEAVIEDVISGLAAYVPAEAVHPVYPFKYGSGPLANPD